VNTLHALHACSFIELDALYSFYIPSQMYRIEYIAHIKQICTQCGLDEV